MLHSRRDGDRQDGQIIVLFELCLVVILACAALVIDLGLLRNNKQILVNTLDSAALAGASTLPVNGPADASAATDLIKANIKANFPGLQLGTDYTITYRCLVGADPVTGAPLISRDVPAMCDPRPSFGLGTTLPPASAFTGAGPRRISACNPAAGDKCNVVVITGSETTPYSIAPVVGLTSGSTGTIVSAACNGSLCGQVIAAPVDLVIILDRTGSMSGNDSSNHNKIASLKTAAQAVLGVYDPAKQRVALALTGPGTVDAAGNPTLNSCPLGGTAYGTADDSNFVPTTTLSGASTTLGSAATTLNAPMTTVSAATASTTLKSRISSTSSTSITVNTTTGFPSVPFYIQVDTEQMKVTATSGTTWTVTRGANGTTAAAHSSGATVTYLAVGPADTTITVTLKTGFPTTYPFSISINSEQMTVTGSPSGTTWTVTRPQDGTAAAHASGVTAAFVVDTAVTTISVLAKNGFPTVFPFTVKIDSEQMSVEGSPSGTLWTVLRGQGGTAPAAHYNLKAVSWDIDNADTTIYVASIIGFPTPPPNFTIQVDTEQMTVSAVAGSSAPYTLTVARGANNTAAAAHNGGKPVAMVVGKADTTIRVASAIGFPASGNFIIMVDSEKIRVDSVSGTATPTTVMNVTRGFNTTAAAHSSGATVMNLTSWVPSASTTDPSAHTDGVWVPVGLSGTDVVTPPSTDPPPNPSGAAGTYEVAGTPNPSSTIVKAINCIQSASNGTTLSMPLAYAKWYLDTYGRAGVTKGILLETDGHPQDGGNFAAGLNLPQFTCTAAIAAATAAKLEGIKIYAVGYGISGTCGRDSPSNSSEANTGMSAATLLQTLATGTTAPYYFNSPSGSDLAGNFRQIAADLAKSGTQLIQLYPTPIVASVSGTTTITISGQYFTGADRVTFGGAPATVSPGMTDTTMTVPTLPSGCHGLVDVVVRTPTGGSSTVTSASKYTCP
jgi:hypothetical protein